LKSNLKWHDGSPVLSKDLAYNLPDVTIDRPDDRTLIFTLKDSFAPFPTLLTGPLIKITPNDEVLGVGEYRLAKAEYHQTQYLYSIELRSEKRNPQTIKIKFFPTEQDAETAFKLGQIQGMQLSSLNNLTGWNNAIFYEKVMPKRFVGVFFNYNDTLVGGKNAQLRQALSYAIPDSEEGQPFKGPFPQGSWAESQSDNKYRNNMDKAKELLDKYKAANKGSSVDLSITLTTLTPYKKTADTIASAWNELGIKTDVAQIDKIPEAFQVLVVAQEIPSDPDQYSLWHSTQKQTNITGYTNVRVDKDLEDARKTVDLNVRKQKYADFEKQIIDDLPVIYLYQPYSTYVLNKKMNTEDIKELKTFSNQ
jgi:peptide/nickel transport system substrate-binding protein